MLEDGTKHQKQNRVWNGQRSLEKWSENLFRPRKCLRHWIIRFGLVAEILVWLIFNDFSLSHGIASNLQDISIIATIHGTRTAKSDDETFSEKIRFQSFRVFILSHFSVTQEIAKLITNYSYDCVACERLGGSSISYRPHTFSRFRSVYQNKTRGENLFYET